MGRGKAATCCCASVAEEDSAERQEEKEELSATLPFVGRRPGEKEYTFRTRSTSTSSTAIMMKEESMIITTRDISSL